jgi:hypothetical protein
MNLRAIRGKNLNAPCALENVCLSNLIKASMGANEVIRANYGVTTPFFKPLLIV